MGRTEREVGDSSNPSKKRKYDSSTKANRKGNPHLRPITGRWDAYDTKFLADMRPVQLLPSRLGSESTLEELGLRDDVETVFDNMGYGRLWKINEPYYPKLVKEFLATCRLTYVNPDRPKANEGTLSFFLNKRHFEYSLFEICDIYGFAKGQDVKFPQFNKKEVDEFWGMIGNGQYVPRIAKITTIRNPVLRVVVKIISNTFFCKKESGAVRDDELWILYYGVKHLIPKYANTPGPTEKFAAMLCHSLVKIKRNPPKKLLVSNVLTPIFQHARIDLSKEEVVDKWDSIDTTYLLHCRVLNKRDVYQFYGRDGVARFCRLPNRGITSIIDSSSLEFDIGEEFLIPDPALRRQEVRVRRLRGVPTPQREPAASDEEIQEDEEEIEEEEEDEPQPRHLLPHSPERYRLPPSPPSNDSAQQLQWIIKSQKKNNSMMRKIWGAIQKIRPCSCVSGSKTQEDESEEEEASPSDNSDEHEMRTKYVHDRYMPVTRVQPGTTDLHHSGSRLNIGRRESSNESPNRDH